MSAINSVLCLDCSGSMSGTPIANAIADATFYTAIQGATDEVGLVSFDSSATNVAALALMTTANKLILFGDLSGLTAGGATNITAAIDNANTMLSASGAIVLLTDGYANVGIYPAVAPSGCQPIYAIGLGSSVNTSNLQGLASTTGGKYYASPTNATLQSMYNEIVSQTGAAAMLTNVMGSTERVIVTGTTTVSEGAASVKIGATWTNAALKYTTGTPSGDELTLMIQCPHGGSMPTTYTDKGTGYVMYEILNPPAGTYTSYLFTSSSNSTSATIGAFDPSQSASLDYEMPKDAKVGQPLPVKCHVNDKDGSKVEKWDLSGFVDSPTIDVETALNLNRGELDALDFDQGDDTEEITDNQRILVLDAQRGPGNPVIPYAQTPLLSIQHGQNENSFSFTPTTPGIHIVTIKGEGYAPVGGRGFSLVRVMTIVVS